MTAGAFVLGKGNGQPKQVLDSVDQNILLANSKHAIGNPETAIKIVEFADFQCPACGQAHPIIKKVLESNKDRAYFVFRHFPLPSHKNSKSAAQAAEAAGEQDKFWEMHDLIFENQKEWSESGKAQEIFESYAQKLGLDLGKFKEDFDKVKNPIEQDYADGNRVGVDSTPTFFINGQKYPGVVSFEQFQKLIDQIPAK
ncbi:hypothetical protein A2697_05470 [Candidatus Curtissbacteria bacterium RIFCSPHIGHO2_01_FULL_41_44]|uniref:Thioredoxin domain-containing protein n=1 Tax=Candidatus Curtissbacteria bacterium RIFCSPLOWO2_01_FULL_42_50 TaxID=1797730 RepID=A0A1F5H483_9BACT|nr:MAG: hypothetical protein A2697_05470 [Candidatus Curtissbacteria bacterium RIFCSPHIGHO2_01_FULL_41_44]OGD93278.1 MAG: hypothetical protein A3C33_04440 [Candidatus Curtissbacteria bacterium RIFCSPHIGHO2_02_FULL_42_58]OGD96918.1 MAG: hypothetical protein A3E71_00450 [Candidatus Curtissbacteria bacterium RIFCSPHIGHO2_12_FULL_42_33]OGD98982.1 MAG: hypothetical protein A3B54_01270 [Candidatus Curtissbacteria bacterium RIFCSPLOWO2_01_FULL_42_50]OGE03529.1 MAG: hypothetical protein A3G16_02830 [Ca